MMGASKMAALSLHTLSRRRFLALAGSSGAAAALAACGGSGAGLDEIAARPSPPTPVVRTPIVDSDAVARPPGWSDATHSNDARPNYDAAFPRDRVPRMTIRVSPGNWAAMLADMTGRSGPRGPVDASSPAPTRTPGRVERSSTGRLGPPNPIWVPATIEFEGGVWTDVGFRFKGTSSLFGGWLSGADRMPFKLDFDEFEDDVPAIDNQRFHGFKQLSLSTNWGDATHMRETISYNLLAAAGLVASRTALYELVLDRGEGEASLGVYTAVEVTDDTVVSRSFEDDSGNIYEGEGLAASFAHGTRGSIRSSFQVQGGDNADWSDLRSLYDHLHSDQRSANPSGWRQGLEAIFDVPVFLHWLGLAAALEHWDSYGQLPHNYYLYNDPATARLTWISWDHNYVLGVGARGGGGGIPAFDKSAAGDDWPLISYLLAQPEYQALYRDSLREIAQAVFLPEALEAQVTGLAGLVRPLVDEQEFAPAVELLVGRIRSRAEDLSTYLAG